MFSFLNNCQIYSAYGVLYRAGTAMADIDQCEGSFFYWAPVASCCDTDGCNAAGNNQPMTIFSVITLPLLASTAIAEHMYH